MGQHCLTLTDGQIPLSSDSLCVVELWLQLIHLKKKKMSACDIAFIVDSITVHASCTTCGWFVRAWFIMGVILKLTLLRNQCNFEHSAVMEQYDHDDRNVGRPKLLLIKKHSTPANLKGSICFILKYAYTALIKLLRTSSSKISLFLFPLDAQGKKLRTF